MGSFTSNKQTKNQVVSFFALFNKNKQKQRASFIVKGYIKQQQTMSFVSQPISTSAPLQWPPGEDLPCSMCPDPPARPYHGLLLHTCRREDSGQTCRHQAPWGEHGMHHYPGSVTPNMAVISLLHTSDCSPCVFFPFCSWPREADLGRSATAGSRRTITWDTVSL